MKLKNVNPNGENVVVSNLINIIIIYFILANCENWVQKQRSYVNFSKRCHDCPRIKFLIFFISQINIEWIKASLVNIDLFHKKKIKINFGSVFGVLIAAWTIRKKH
jgi:hypothetical protein